MLKRPAVSGGVRAGALGIADQVLLSVVNLAAGLALARELEPAAFGVYVVAFAVSLAGASVPLALVTDPLIVLGSPRQGDDQSRYFGALVRLQLFVSVATGASIGLVAALMHLAWGSTSQLPSALAAVAVATVPAQMQAYFRAVFFARLRPAAVLCNDLFFSVLRLGALAVLIVTGRLSPLTAILVGGGAALVAALAALPFCRDLFAARPDSLRETWRAHWSYGRWLLATSGAYWLSGQAPTLMASSLLTPVAAAIIKACQYLVAPLNVAFNGLDGILAPRATRLRTKQGQPALSRFLSRFALAAGAGVALYTLVVLPAAPWIMDFIYKGRYQGYVPIVAVLLIDGLFTALGRAPILRLKVLGDTRRIFVGYLWAAAAGLACLASLAPVLGVLGAAVAAPVSSGTLLAYLSIAWFSRSTHASIGGATRAAVSEP